MNYTKHFNLSSSLTAELCCKIHDLLSGRLHFSGSVCSVLSVDECLIKIYYRRVCVCLEKVSLWSRFCLAKDEFRYHRLHVYMICDLELE